MFVLCFFSSENLQYVLQTIFDNNLGVPITLKDHASDCRVFTPDHATSYIGNITDNLDVFTVCHFLGWFFKVLIFRNKTMAWTMSIGFEIMELSFEVYLPNFRECWWDHLVLDVLGCNLLGMLIGFYAMRVFKMRQLYWFMEPSSETRNMSIWQKFVHSFTCRDEYIKNRRWHWLSSIGSFCGVLFFCATNYAMDLAYFFVKSEIHIPSAHWIFMVRIWIFAFFAILSVNDYYDCLTSDTSSISLSMPIFINFFIVGCEWLLFVKHARRSLSLTQHHFSMQTCTAI